MSDINPVNPVAMTVFIAFFVLVTVIGFFAARWKRGDLTQLHEWGLGGRQFGTVISWFLVGGDFYTAYTVIAVPALVFRWARMASSRCRTRSSFIRSCSR